MRRFAFVFTFIFSVAAIYGAEKPFPAPELVGDPTTFGAKIQRTMTLLATSTPEKHNRVRILFYGQSVTRNPWWEDVAADLRARFPHADLEIENRAIGGYGGPVLINTAEYDLYPFYPDLLIFHVWSGVETGEQEKILRRVRQRTTAEILLWTSNLRWPKSVPPDGDPQHPEVIKVDSQDRAISELYQRLGRELGCEVADVRAGMQCYLAGQGKVVKDTLRDTVHPNELGNFLIAELIKPHLRHDSAFDRQAWESLVTDIGAGDSEVKHSQDGSFELTFQGNRVDLIAAADMPPSSAEARILIDGRPPSEFPELYHHERPSPTPFAGRPAINRMDHEAPLLLETWTARILECDPEKDILRYEISGSKTGPDGVGDHHKRFVSNSGRVVIEPGMWMVNWSLRYRNQTLPEGYTVNWKTAPLFTDVWTAPADVDRTRESAATIARGLTNKTHTVKIIPVDGKDLPIASFRVYRPPLP